MNRLALTYLGAILAAGLVAMGYAAGQRSTRCPPPPSCELAEQAAVLEWRLEAMEATLAAERAGLAMEVGQTTFQPRRQR